MSSMATVVVSLGNPVRADNGIGIYVARSLQAMVVPPNVTVIEANVSGRDTLDLLCGYN
jgi:hydrogenase maturation protease